ncbi:hypothetical protein BDR06DRAFT_416102 [Suillus hirtellus]|nr:hypothetical protein BDR06DRAFT_416102 [Suillus hirtellus]
MFFPPSDNHDGIKLDHGIPRRLYIFSKTSNSVNEGDRGWPATTIKIQRSSEFLFLVNFVRVPCTSSNTHSVKRITPEPAIPNAHRLKSLSLNRAFTNYAHIYYRIQNRHEPLPPKHNRYTNPFRLYNADVFKCLSDLSLRLYPTHARAFCNVDSGRSSIP